MQEFSRERITSTPLDVDIVIVGSGSGGVSAAIAAARQGASVLVLDKNGYAGGMLASGLPYLGYLDMKQRPAVGGLALEYVDELVKGGASYGVRYCPKHLSIVATNADKVKLLTAKMLLDNGVHLILHSYLIDATVENGKISKLKFDCAGNRFEVTGKIFIDATGDGVLAAIAGAPFEKGVAGINLQPSSVIYTIGGVDKERFFRWVERNPENMPPYTMEYLRERPDFVFVTMEALWKKLNPIGQWPMKGIWAMILMNRLNDSEVALNGPRVPATDSTDANSITFAEIEGHRQAEAFVECLRIHCEGFEKAFVSHVSDNIGVRESRRVVGKKTLTIDKVLESVVDEETIALGSYPVDIHSSKDHTSTFHHVEEPYGIPYLATVAATIDNLMMSGRCISTDSNAFGSTRVMGTCFAVGEGVGIGAALAVKENIAPADVDVKKIRQILKKNGAVLEME